MRERKFIKDSCRREEESNHPLARIPTSRTDQEEEGGCTCRLEGKNHQLFERGGEGGGSLPEEKRVKW